MKPKIRISNSEANSKSKTRNQLQPYGPSVPRRPWPGTERGHSRPQQRPSDRPARCALESPRAEAQFMGSRLDHGPCPAPMNRNGPRAVPARSSHRGAERERTAADPAALERAARRDGGRSGGGRFMRSGLGLPTMPCDHEPGRAGAATASSQAAASGDEAVATPDRPWEGLTEASEPADSEGLGPTGPVWHRGGRHRVAAAREGPRLKPIG